MYKVTLSMPLYNVEKYIERALLSALNQTFESIEYILVDDKGNDNSVAIARKIIRDHPRGKDVRIIEHCTNCGLGAVRNTGLDNSHAKYIFFMDSDDEITPDCIETLYNAMIETPVDFVASSYKVVVPESGVTALDQSTSYKDKLVSGANHAVAKAVYMDKLQIRVYTWNKLYSVAFLKNYQIRCIPHHTAEDIFFTFQIILNANSCRLLSKFTYYYYQNLGSISQDIHNKVSIKVATQMEESTIAKNEYSMRFKGMPFYLPLMRYTYIGAVNWAMKVRKSKVMGREDKKKQINALIDMVLNGHCRVVPKLLALPIGFICKLPNVDVKLFLVKVVNKMFFSKKLFLHRFWQ